MSWISTEGVFAQDLLGYSVKYSETRPMGSYGRLEGAQGYEGAEAASRRRSSERRSGGFRGRSSTDAARLSLLVSTSLHAYAFRVRFW